MKYKAILRYVVSIALLGVLIYQFDITLSLKYLIDADYKWVIASLIATLLNVFFSSERIRKLLEIYQIKRGVLYLSKIYLIGNFYNNFLPTQVGGDLYKAYKISADIKRDLADNKIRVHDDHTENIGTISTFVVFMDRFSGLFLLYIVSLVGLALKFKTSGIIFGIIGLISIVTGYYLFTRVNLKIKFLEKFKKINKLFFKNKQSFVYVFVTAFLVQVFAIFTQIFCFYAVGVSVSMASALIFLPIITILGLIPSVNGLGIQDASYVFFFGTNVLVPSQVISASLMYHIVRFFVSLLGGVFILFSKDR